MSLCIYNSHIGVGAGPAGPAGPVLAGPLFLRFNEINFSCNRCTPLQTACHTRTPITAGSLQKSFLRP